MTPRVAAIVEAVVEISKQRQKTPVQVAIAWILSQPTITAVVTGTDTPQRVRDSSGAVGWSLDDRELALLNEVSWAKSDE